MEIGIDLVEVERIGRTIGRFGDRFLSRVFTEREKDFCGKRSNPYPSYAVRFAAKEALLKALGTGLSRGMRWRDIEILDDEHSKPKLLVKGEVGRLVGGREILLSLSHTKGHGLAVVVIQ